MTNVQVVFPKSGDPIVSDMDEAVMEGQYVFWNFRSENPAIKSVKITFDDPDRDDFFPGHELIKDLRTMHGAQYGAQHVEIYGTAPHFPEQVRKTTHKYTVEGLSANGKSLAKLDPKIVSTKP